jgi:hypothetical protein
LSDNRWARTTFAGKVLQGLIFGFTAIIGMMNPFVLTEGIIFDGRSVVLSLATLFFGPLTGPLPRQWQLSSGLQLVVAVHSPVFL